MPGAAERAIKRIKSSIKVALEDEYDTLPGKVDSATRLSYLLGLQKAVEIIEKEIERDRGQELACTPKSPYSHSPSRSTRRKNSA